MRIELRVNGAEAEADCWEGESLLFALREKLGYPGSKNACEQGECGSCSVLLDGDHVVAVRLGGEDEARADELPVEQHRARPALALLARVLRSRKAELLAQREEERLSLPAVGLVLLAVDPKRDPHASTRFSARAARICSAWRR